MRQPRSTRRFAIPMALALGLALALCAVPAHAKTIILTAQDADRVAAIADVAPRMSLCFFETWPGTMYMNQVGVSQGRSVLMRYNLASIPAGQRITHAEWVLPVTSFSGSEPRFYAWRMIAEWGPGVCHLYRVTLPKKVEWVRPGARGHSSDRATRPSEIIRLTEAGERVINVTEDLELWYTKAAPNNGWMLTVEDPGVQVIFPSPVWAEGVNTWKLRITYEPE